MYKEEELLNKVEGHLKEKEINLLKSLIDDIDEFNGKQCDKLVELYIDFCDVDSGGEWNPYETFSIKMLSSIPISFTPLIQSELTLTELDAALAGILGYFEEIDNINKPLNESLIEDNNNILKKIKEAKEDDCIIFKTEDSIRKIKFENIINQPLESILFDINRLPEVLIATKSLDSNKFDQHWINDLALINILKYYYNKCQDLESQLKIAEEKMINNSILK